MLRRLLVLVLIVTFNMFLTGCMSLSEKFYAYKQKVELQKLANQDDQYKNERKQIIDKYLNVDPEQSTDPVIKTLMGEYKGSTCGGKTDVNITISNAFIFFPGLNTSQNIVFAYGKMRASDYKGRNFEIYIQGRIDKNKGLLIIESTKQPTFKDFIERVSMNTDRYTQMILDDTVKDSRELDAYEKKFLSRKLADGASFESPVPALRMNLARDAEGKGWVGAFMADGFDDCTELAMQNMAPGKGTDMFHPVNSALAFNSYAISNEYVYPYTQKGSLPERQKEYGVKNKLYWYKVAEKMGYDSIDVTNAMAESYINMAQAHPQSSAQYFQKVREYYLKNATAFGDARAQLALAQIYRNGLGTPVNKKESDKWQALAAKTYAEAKKICSSPKTIDVFQLYLKRSDQNGALLAGGLAAMTNVHVNTGSSQLVSISADNVVTIDRPFVCAVFAKRIGAGADASDVPYYNEHWGIFTLGASFLDRFLKKSQAYKRFNINPLGKHKYKVEAVEIDLR